ncbi:MAG: ribosome maturation factor RimM [Pseudomonadota bacterium]
MQNDKDYIVIGKVGTTYGVQGWLKIVSYTESTADIIQYDPWYLEDKRTWQQIKVSVARPHGKGIIAKLSGYDSPEAARTLTGKKIGIKREQLNTLAQHEYYWAQLEGLTVIDQHGAVLGKIIYIIETGSNDVLVVKGDGKEFAIPYRLGETIINIDLAEQVMKVNWDLI